jgi:hypothetical protein
MLSPSPSVPDRFTIPFAWVLPLLSLRSGATLFLPLPAVPDVPFCLSFAQRAIRPALTVSPGRPNPEALRLGGVMLSPTLLANTASSAGLTHSSRFPFVSYTGDLWHSRVVRACRSDPPLFTPPISHRLPPSIRRPHKSRFLLSYGPKFSFLQNSHGFKACPLIRPYSLRQIVKRPFHRAKAYPLESKAGGWGNI